MVIFVAMMKKILKVDHPNVYAEHVGAPTLHPLLSVISFDEVSPVRNSLNNYGVYGLFIQREFPKNLSYGTRPLQVSDASIVAVAPGQLGGGEDDGEPLMLSGWLGYWRMNCCGSPPAKRMRSCLPIWAFRRTRIFPALSSLLVPPSSLNAAKSKLTSASM